MRLLFVVLLLLLGLIQYPLWLGKGGWFKVWELRREVAQQREVNDGLRMRNAALDAEVRDLQSGTEAIEERARGELGMMREGEIFVHILPPTATPPQPRPPSATGKAPAR
jgi:Septum formation initiator